MHKMNVFHWHLTDDEGWRIEIKKYPELTRKVPEYAYETLVDYAISLGVMQAFIQEGDTAKESFIPPFTLEGV